MTILTICNPENYKVKEIANNQQNDQQNDHQINQILDTETQLLLKENLPAILTFLKRRKTLAVKKEKIESTPINIQFEEFVKRYSPFRFANEQYCKNYWKKNLADEQRTTIIEKLDNYIKSFNEIKYIPGSENFFKKQYYKTERFLNPSSFKKITDNLVQFIPNIATEDDITEMEKKILIGDNKFF